MECPMCYELYDANVNIPRNLLCGHTICECCLLVMEDKKTQITCPSCRFRHDCSVKVQSLSKNYIALEIATQKQQQLKNLDFCKIHDQPFRFFCQTDSMELCIECVVEHSGHQFVKQDMTYTASRRQWAEQLSQLQKEQQKILQAEKGCTVVREQLYADYEARIRELDVFFIEVKKRLIDEHYRCKKELQNHLEKQLQGINLYENGIASRKQTLQLQQTHHKEAIKRIETEKKSIPYENRPPMDSIKKLKFVQFPGLELPHQALCIVAQVHSKRSVRICFFGQRKKLFMLCPETNTYSLTILSQTEIHYFSSACTLPNGDVLITGGGGSNNVHLFSLRDPQYLVPKPKMASIRKEHCSVYLNGSVYVLSGYNSKSKDMADCEAYDVRKQEWRQIPSLLVPRCAFAACACLGKLYVFGGYNGKERLSSIEVYEGEQKGWRILNTKLEFPLSNAAAVSSSQFIYIIGGGYSQGFNLGVYRFDTVKEQLVSVSQMRKGRDLRNKAVVYRDSVYTVGGNSFDGEVLGLKSLEWTDLRPYNELVNENLQSWCCAMSYRSAELEDEEEMDMASFTSGKMR